MRAHTIPMPLFWAVQAGRSFHQFGTWLNLAREYKRDGKRYDHAVRYAKMARKEYRRLIELSVQTYINHMVDKELQTVRIYPWFSQARDGSPIQPR